MNFNLNLFLPQLVEGIALGCARLIGQPCCKEPATLAQLQNLRIGHSVVALVFRSGNTCNRLRHVERFQRASKLAWRQEGESILGKPTSGIFFCCERLSASMARSLHLSFICIPQSTRALDQGGAEPRQAVSPKALRPWTIPLRYSVGCQHQESKLQNSNASTTPSRHPLQRHPIFPA